MSNHGSQVLNKSSLFCSWFGRRLDSVRAKPGSIRCGKRVMLLQCTKHDTYIIHKEVKHIFAAEARLYEPLKLLAECVCVCVHRVKWGTNRDQASSPQLPRSLGDMI